MDSRLPGNNRHLGDTIGDLVRMTQADRPPSTPIRVCFPLVGDTLGGSHISTLELVRHLNRRTFSPVIALHEVGPVSAYLQNLDIPYVLAPRGTLVGRVGAIATARAMLSSAIRLRRFLRTNGLRVVHTNDLRMHMSWGPAARLAAAKYVLHHRTPAPGLKATVPARFANAIITISEYCRQSFPSSMRRRAHVITNPFSLPDTLLDRVTARSVLLRELDETSNCRVVAFVANFTERKRPLTFVDIVDRLQQRNHAGVRALMFGEPREPMAANVASRIANLGLEKVCEVVGPRFPIEPVLAGCDVLVVPAVNEGFGRTLVEAMLVGTPVVASRSGAHSEIIEDGVTGLLVEPDQPKAFASAVGRLLDDPPLANELAATAQAVAQERYSAAKHARTVESVYARLLRVDEP